VNRSPVPRCRSLYRDWHPDTGFVVARGTQATSIGLRDSSGDARFDGYRALGTHRTPKAVLMAYCADARE
jgi:hypothetical protein